MGGLLDAHLRMSRGGVQAVPAAAAIAFDFVYVHRFQDGNGRIHRYLHQPRAGNGIEDHRTTVQAAWCPTSSCSAPDQRHVAAQAQAKRAKLTDAEVADAEAVMRDPFALNADTHERDERQAAR